MQFWLGTFLAFGFTTACVTTPDRSDLDFELSKSALTVMSQDMKKSKSAESPVNVANFGCWKDKCRMELSAEEGKIGSLALNPDDLKALLAAMKKAQSDEPIEASSANSSVSCSQNECKFMVSKDVEIDAKSDFWLSDLLTDLKAQTEAKPTSRSQAKKKKK